MDEPRPYFLDVSKSVLGRPWIDRLNFNTQRIATAIGQRTGLSDILARIVASRGVGVDEAEAFLQPTVRALMPDPSTLADMDVLAERLATTRGALYKTLHDLRARLRVHLQDTGHLPPSSPVRPGMEAAL